MQYRLRSPRRSWRTRALSLLMTAVLLLGLVPAMTSGAQAAHWAAPYLDQLVDWGFLRADQSISPDRPLTRAEFMAIINRAYGYAKVGPMPFSDVAKTDWFYDDVAIAYNARYIQGTSKTTASPNGVLTREQAVYILARNMRLKDTAGENMSFSDGRSISTWSEGMVRSAVDHYIVTGYADGTFRPQSPVSRSEMAALLYRSIGTPLQKPGDYSLGGVFGNVTITSSGVTLRDTTISGDLYITGGVSLGNVKLENVTVLGRIITSGTGESEKGDVSLVMRNVIAQELLVDNLQNQYVSLRTEGITEIGKTTVRTSAYLQDNTPEGLGLKQILLDGGTGVALSLAGRIGEVVNQTPGSSVVAARGTVQKLTVDELAIGSKLQIDRGAEVKELNLDVGTQVSGAGDIKTLNVNTAGSTVTMLPEQVVIRPGINANISGQQMDSAAAEEASREPKLLSGYPTALDVAPTSFSGSFAANKKGTVYWAVSAVADGSVGADDLIKPPAYGSPAVKNGSISTPAADSEVQAKVTGLTVGGSYYLSAVLVDARNQRSPVKVAAFTTPDNSKPDFASGYPYLSRVTNIDAQVTVMPTKSCKLYYALLPKGATAPTASELKSNAVTGRLGYGVRDVIKNTEDSFTVNDKLLVELQSYDLYLWLSDADGANSSAVKKVSFSTADKTPPVFVVEPTVNKVQATAVGLAFTLNEAGTVYWAVVKEGTDYPKPKPGETSILPTDPYAILQVASGLNALKSGTVAATANKEGTINITGLDKETAYDLWYLAQDKAGNYSVEVKKLLIHTLDDTPPTVKQYFTSYTGTDNTQNPTTGTDIVLEFSEGVRSAVEGDGDSFLSLYDAVVKAADPAAKANARNKLAAALQNTIKLYQDTGTGAPAPVSVRTVNNEGSIGDSWVIDYRNATVTARDGKVLLTFPTKANDTAESALNLASGATYYFELKDITDTSNRQNMIVPNPVSYVTPAAAGHKVPRFTTVFAQLFLSNPPEVSGKPPMDGAAPIRVDLSFRMSPVSTSKVDDSISYDLALWSDTIVQYNLYYRVARKDGTVVTDTNMPQGGSPTLDANGWVLLGNSGAVNPAQGQLAGKSLNNHFNKFNTSNFPKLNTLDESLYYEFAISLTQVGTSTDFRTWSGQVSFKIQAAAGTSNTLYTLSQGLTTQTWQSFKDSGLNNNGIVSVGISASSQDFLQVRQLFTDTQTPIFVSSSPTFAVGDTFVTMSLNLDRKGTVYYVIAPAGKDGSSPLVTTTKTDGSPITWTEVPTNGSVSFPTLTLPNRLDIYQPPYNNALIKTGSVSYPGGQAAFEKLVQGLEPKTDYYAYFVLKGAAQDLSPVHVFKFTTSEVSKPKIDLERYTGIVDVRTQVDSSLNYIVFTANDLNKVPQFKSLLRSNTAYGGQIPPEYENLTIIDAMITTYNDQTARIGATSAHYVPEAEFNGYSVFDIYASDSIKATVAQIIRSGASSSSSTASGAITTTANQKKTVDETRRMTPLTSHYFLTVAHHQASQSGVGDAFKAVDNVTLPDQIAPELTSSSTVIGSSTGPFSGSVTITFDKNLYWSPGTVSAVAKPVYNTGNTATEDKDWVGILQYLGGSARSKLTISSTVNSPGRSFTLTFNNLSLGDQVILFNNGLVSNSSGYTTPKTLTLTLKEYTAKNDSGLPIVRVEFEANWGGTIIK